MQFESHKKAASKQERSESSMKGEERRMNQHERADEKYAQRRRASKSAELKA
jgi:hypothetical protein